MMRFFSQRTEGSCLIHLVFQSGPKWPMTRRCVHCALRRKERIRWAKERCVRPGGRVQPWPLLGDRQKKAQHVHWSERGKKTLNGFRLCNCFLIIDHHDFFFYFITKKPLNISHRTTSQHQTPTQWLGFLIISSDLNSEGLAKLLLAVLHSLFQDYGCFDYFLFICE